MSENILTTMFNAMRTDYASYDGYYAVKQTRESYTLREDNEMKGYTPTVTAYSDEIVCDIVFLNPVSNAKYWSTRVNKGDGDITV